MGKLGLIVTLCIIAIITVSNPLTEQYLMKLRSDAAVVSKQQDALYEMIESKAPEFEQPVYDAKIDPVWKSVPGYNGLQVDIKKSYDKMKPKGKFLKDKLVYKEIKPKVHLSDLPPAAIYRGHPEKPIVSFIINVAWGNEYLSDMLATLKKHNVLATFFLEGHWVKENPDLAKMIVEAGHEVGNHSFSHPNMKELPAAAVKEEIEKTNAVIEATTGKRIKWFAPPSGYYREEVVKIAAAMKLGTIMWSVDTIDWKKPTPDQLINRVMSKVHNGAFILMHPTESTEEALDQLILQIKNQGLELGTVSDNLSEDRIMLKNMKK